MKTCLQNCRPGDLIKTVHGHTFIVTESLNQYNLVKVQLENGVFAGSFGLCDIVIITKIIKVK